MAPKKNIRLKKRLLDVGKTQKKLAHDTGIGESWISLIAAGRYIPTTDQQIRIADALECQPEEIFN